MEENIVTPWDSSWTGILIFILIGGILTNNTIIYTFIHDKIKQYLLLPYVKRTLDLNEKNLSSPACSVKLKTEPFTSKKINTLGWILCCIAGAIVLWIFITPDLDHRGAISFTSKEELISPENSDWLFNQLIFALYFLLPGGFFLSFNDSKSIKENYVLLIENKSQDNKKFTRMTFFDKNLANKVKNSLLNG